MSDPWKSLPNLTGHTADELTGTRAGDPSRVFASPRGGVLDPVTGRILDLPRVRVTRNAALAIPSATLVTIAWDANSAATRGLLWDNDGMWSSARSTELVCKTAGLWDFYAQWYWATVTTVATYRQAYFQHLPSGRIFGQSVAPPTGSGGGVGTVQSIFSPIPMDAGQSVIVNLAHNDAAINGNMGSDNCWFGATWRSSFGSDN